MSDHIVKGTNEKDKAILAVIGVPIQEWLQHAYEDKARRCIDRIIEIASDRNPKKMTESDKMTIIQELEFETQSAERQAKDLEKRIRRLI